MPILTKAAETQSCHQGEVIHGTCDCYSAMSATELCSSQGVFKATRWGIFF